MATATVTTAALAQEKIWFDKPSYDKAERKYFEKKTAEKKLVRESHIVIDVLILWFH